MSRFRELFKIFPVYFGVVFGSKYVKRGIFQHFKKIDVLVVCLKIVLHKSRFAVFFYGDGEGQITYAHFFYFVGV